VAEAAWKLVCRWLVTHVGYCPRLLLAAAVAAAVLQLLLPPCCSNYCCSVAFVHFGFVSVYLYHLQSA